MRKRQRAESAGGGRSLRLAVRIAPDAPEGRSRRVTEVALTGAGCTIGRSMTPFRTSREIPASPEQVFAAFTDAQRLARWWGPAGFTNTFMVCDFTSGGRW